ncbi:Epidermal growth factor receptor kinase substrate 8-like [Oopsacas minuta]|uniref:Epidermal growth factor receptor kinase substrate 8-like n=1 Tax=Oopsacas minuta TaxID=111878 RepID=A0AAV7K3U5_9METZ|nr:Epidermal growth factor receptor kinase substrate 8-like [Oopsacas minuta]
MGSGKDDKKAKTKKKTLSDHYSEEEKYWSSFNEKSNSLSRDRDRNFLMMSAKSNQKDTNPESPPGKNKTPILTPPVDLIPTRGLGLQDSDPNTSRFQVDHLVTLHYPSGRPQLPEESVQRMRELAISGTLYSQEVYLCVASSYLAIRQFHTNEVINWFPMLQISKVYAYSGKKEFPNLLIVHTHDNRGSKPFIHIFGCEQANNREIRDLLISFLNRRYSSELTHTPQMDTIEEHSSSGEDAPPTHRKLSIWEKLSSRPSTKSKALIFEEGAVAEGGAVRTDKSPPSHKIGLAAAELNQQRNKANLIQRDIDLLNAALDDVELTADLVHNYITYQKVGKKKKKGRTSSRPSEPPRPPSKTELIDSFQKSRYATNLLGKLGHHLRNPNCCEILNLLMETIKGLSDFTGGFKLVSAVNVPLLTDRSVRLLSRGLSKEMKVYWTNLGTNWMLTHSSWPQTKPIPKYDVIFSNGYTIDNLPLNEPTIWGNLDPLPELERPTDYSDAYDHIQVIPQAVEKISKDIESAVFKQAKQVKSRAADSHTDSTHSLSSSKQTPQPAVKPPSLTALPQENQLIITQDYKRRSKEQLSVYRGEVVDVLEKRTDAYIVRNTLGEQGFVPISSLTGEKLPSRRQSPTVPRKDSQPQPTSRRGSSTAIGDIPNFDPPPVPFSIPPPPPDIPPNWPHDVIVKPARPAVKLKSKGQHHLAFEDAGIIRELSKRKPLRTTSNNPKHFPTNQQPDNIQSEIALKFQREPPVARKPDVNPITTSSTKEDVLLWLQHYSYLIAAERLRGMKGSDLISVTKEELRNVCGFGEGTRLFSHLQKQGAGGGGHQLETMSTLLPGRDAGDDQDRGGFSKFLKEHRDKISGKSPHPDEGPSVWQQIQASKAETEKLERRRQKEEIWARRRRTRELEEQADRQDTPPPVEREETKKKSHRKGSRKDDTKERRSRRRHKTSHKIHVSSESSDSADSDTTSVTSSDYDSYSTSSQSSEDVKETKSKKKEPTSTAPPPVAPQPAAPQYPGQMYPQMLPHGYPQVGYMPSPHIQYQEMMTQQLLHNQQVAHAEQDAWNAEMRLKQLRTQQAMGLPHPPTGMYGAYGPSILPTTPSYGYPSFERNYTSII